MIRHIYDLSYNQEQPSTFQERLIFCMNVFIVADKYDIASLRQKVVPDFSDYLQSAWQSDEFAECVKKLCGPNAIHLADPSLQVLNSLMSKVSWVVSLESFCEMFNSQVSSKLHPRESSFESQSAFRAMSSASQFSGSVHDIIRDTTDRAIALLHRRRFGKNRNGPCQASAASCIPRARTDFSRSPSAGPCRNDDPRS